MIENPYVFMINFIAVFKKNTWTIERKYTNNTASKSDANKYFVSYTSVSMFYKSS